MNKKELIKKWLDNNLNSEEQKALEQLEDYKTIIRIDGALKSFKSPNFDIDDNYTDISHKLQLNEKKAIQWHKPLLRIAAILAICFSVYFYSTTLNTEVNTQIAQQTNVELPDASSVNLNANSTLTFNKKNWEDSRKVNLNGEAFFKVAKGKKFDVITDYGTISVLGTQFNVKQRKNYFEVTCYEGLVAVNYKNNSTKLKPGNKFLVIDGKLYTHEKETTAQPTWLRGESSFKNVALKHVISELENQYAINITIGNIDNTRLFTGTFTHKNLDLALQSVTIPLNLRYNKSGNSIVLKRE